MHYLENLCFVDIFHQELKSLLFQKCLRMFGPRRPYVFLITWSIKAESHDFFCCCTLRNLFDKYVFIIVYVHVFLSEKIICFSWVHSFFMGIFRIYAHLGDSIQRFFFMRYPKICRSVGGWNHNEASVG